MTFDFTEKQSSARDAARAFARERLVPVAASIDATAAIPADVLRDAQALVVAGAPDMTAQVVAIEELAAASAAVAAAAALQQGARESLPDAPGLRGFVPPRVGAVPAWLFFAAIAVGIGRAALDHAIGVLRDAARTPHDLEKPHWVVADAATEVQAGRMLTLRAAGLAGESHAAGHMALAKLAASRAAHQAVDAALRVAGPEAYARGAMLERLARDARAVSLLIGAEEELRMVAADAMLPR